MGADRQMATSKTAEEIVGEDWGEKWNTGGGKRDRDGPNGYERETRLIFFFFLV